MPYFSQTNENCHAFLRQIPCHSWVIPDPTGIEETPEA